VGVSWGIPWAKGALAIGQPLSVLSASGQPIPTQSWPLAFWPDGSIKWSGLAITAPESLSASLSVSIATPVAPAAPVLVKEDADSVVISSGSLRCLIAKSGSSILESLSLDGREIARKGRLIALREDRSDLESKRTLREEEFQSLLSKVVVEQAGPVRAVVRLEGKHKALQGERAWLPFTLRLYITAGTGSIRIVHSFVFDGDAQKDFLRGLGLAFTVPFREELQNRHIRLAGEASGLWAEPVLMSPGHRDVLVKNARQMCRDQLNGLRIPNLDQLGPKTKSQFETIAVWDAFKLSQLSPDSYSIDKRTGSHSSWLHVTNGHRSLGLAFLGDVSGGLAMGLKGFWEKYPASIEITGASTPAAELKLWLWSPDAPAMDLRHYDTKGHGLSISYEDYEPGFSTPEGIANTSELTLWVTGNTPDNTALLGMAKAASCPPLLVCKPERYHSSAVFGIWSLPDRSTPGSAALEDGLDRAFAFLSREVGQRHWYGYWNFGDMMRSYDSTRHQWRYDIGGHAWLNAELMPDAWLWYTFLRSGRADAFRIAEAMTRHTSEVDVHHTGRFAGLGSRHNVSHWGCGAKECRISEAFLKRFYYYLSTDERTGDLLREVLQVDSKLAEIPPLRKLGQLPKLDPHKVPVLVRSGPDWLAFASNWMTEWERTGDTRYRDYVLTGMQGLGAAPEALIKRLAFGYDPKTKKIWDIGEPNIGADHFIMIFGGDQIAFELMQLIDCPEFSKAWEGLCTAWVTDSRRAGAAQIRAIAYAARAKNDPALAKIAWRMLADSLREHNSERFPAKLSLIQDPDIPEPILENPYSDPAGTAQWALNIITATELLRAHPQKQSQ
jgi:hypothetical protein